jgi:hypothetical protein
MQRVPLRQAAAARRRSVGDEEGLDSSSGGGDGGGGGGGTGRGVEGTIGDEEEQFVVRGEEEEDFADFGGAITLRAPGGDDDGDGEGSGGEEGEDALSTHSTVSEFMATGRAKGPPPDRTLDDPARMRPVSPEATLRLRGIERVAKGEAPY